MNLEASPSVRIEEEPEQRESDQKSPVKAALIMTSSPVASEKIEKSTTKSQHQNELSTKNSSTSKSKRDLNNQSRTNGNVSTVDNSNQIEQQSAMTGTPHEFDKYEKEFQVLDETDLKDDDE